MQAHPFRHADYIRGIHLSTGCVDAVEAANGGNEPAWDALAMRYARNLELPVTAGSDIHHVNQIETGPLFGVYLEERMRSIADYVKAVKEKRIAGLRLPPGRCDFTGHEVISLPVDIRDGNDRRSPRELSSLLS